MTDELDTAVQLAADHLANAIRQWDKKDLCPLVDWITELNELCDNYGLNFGQQVDFTSLPSVEIPEDIDTLWPVWAMDEDNYLLTGAEMTDIEHIDEVREAQADVNA